MFKLSLMSFVLCFALNASAKKFANGYTEFELPKGWSCAIEGSEWVCQSETKDRQKEAIIILAAKKRGQQDTLPAYKKYLSKAKTYKLPGAKLQRSEPRTTSMNTINNQEWVDALHLASEVPGFYTRYLATVKSDIGVAVTFSVTKSMYSSYKGIFDEVIRSMRIFRQARSQLSGTSSGKKSGEGFGDMVFEDPDSANLAAVAVEDKKKSSGSDADELMLYGLLALVGGFVVFKMKGGKKKKVAATKKKKKKKVKKA